MDNDHSRMKENLSGTLLPTRPPQTTYLLYPRPHTQLDGLSMTGILELGKLATDHLHYRKFSLKREFVRVIVLVFISCLVRCDSLI